MESQPEGEQNDATTDGELVQAMSPVEKKVFILAFVILVASIAAASVFLSLEDFAKRDAAKKETLRKDAETKSDSVKEPVTPTIPAQPVEPAPQPVTAN